MSSGTLLGICGSLRAASWNRKLMLEAARMYDPAEFLDADLRLPLYDGDLEEAHGIPPEVQRLADQIKAADAVVIAGPEYNKALSGVLKNALDWVSRVPGGVWRDKPVAILSAAAGRAGGERTQMTLRHAMNPFRAHVLPGPEVMIAAPDREFDAEGRLVNEIPVKLLTELMEGLRRAAS
ncbi:NADPH-dependent FMN reductase [Roseicyclus amphidinii]|uniref:NADPH-dependent FMN reductase n=1 Tax=Roseicyclus amphidinii TaxID=3034232 RepID=UPI0024E08170|nr:NAD(P)H-dependent oxidoreductase [Roseicyclus sp. Amp-Y-6]